MHATVILAQDVREYAPLFSEIADAYYDQRMYMAAVTIYEELGQDPAVRHSLLHLQVLLTVPGTDEQYLRFGASRGLPSNER